MDNPYPQRIARCGKYKKVSAEVVPHGWKLRFQWKKARAKVKGKNLSLMSEYKYWKPAKADIWVSSGWRHAKITIASCM